jgi:small conductance mechanosensitive channel
MNPIRTPHVLRLIPVSLCLALLAGAAFAQAPFHATATIPAANPSALLAVLPVETDLHARFHVALGQVEGKLVQLVAAAPLLLVAITIVLLAAWLGRVLSRRGHWLRLRSHNPYMDGLVRRIVQTFVLLAGVLVALDLLGATSLVGAVLGSAGVVGLVLGFAFKDIAENYVSGILLSLRRPFSPGDHVVIDTREGKVVALDSRATTLMTLDGSQLRLPNALVFKSVVLNYSVNPKRRFEFSMILDAGQSIRRAQGLAMEVIGAVDGVLTDPAPSSLVQEYAPSGITLGFFGWIDQRGSDLGKVRSEAIRQVKVAYAKADVQAPRTVSHVILAREAGRDDRVPMHVEAGSADTSVNRDIDQQLAAAQRASDDDNLLDGKPLPNKPSPNKP